MRVFCVVASRATDVELAARLAQAIDPEPIEPASLTEVVAPGDICFATAEGLAQIGDRARSAFISATLGIGAHLVVLPPLPGASLAPLVSGLERVHFGSAAFGPIDVIDPLLREASGLEKAVILFGSTVVFPAGTSAALAPSGAPVIVRYQHGSTWGQLVCTTLLLGSLSARSQRSHRLALLRGIVTWLAGLGPAVATLVTAAPEPVLATGGETPCLVLALYLAQREGTVDSESMERALSHVRSRLSVVGGKEPTAALMAEMEATGVLEPAGEARWRICPERLVEEISHYRLAGYLRRLR